MDMEFIATLVGSQVGNLLSAKVFSSCHHTLSLVMKILA